MLHVAVIDIGKPGKNLGWAVSGPTELGGCDLDTCIDVVAAALRVGPLALGFEAPMFVPFRDDPLILTKARSMDVAKGISRPFSASAGATVLVTALVIVPYVLARLRKRFPHAKATMNWRSPLADRADLLLFEAFVTNQGKRADNAQRHEQDARRAVEAFKAGMQNPSTSAGAIEEPECLSLLGAAMLRTGWATDPAVLAEPCLVVRA